MFEGRDGFEWFTGVVEDRNDPKALNRVRVRIFGIHTENKQKIATPDLPWATVMMPTTSSSISGLGTTVHGLVEGSWVIGFFRDGAANQQPVIMGSLIGQPSKTIRLDRTLDDKGKRKEDKIKRFENTDDEQFKGPVTAVDEENIEITGDIKSPGIKGTITDVTIEDRGGFYNKAPTVTISSPSVYTKSDDEILFEEGDELPEGKQVGDVKKASIIPEGKKVGDTNLNGGIPAVGRATIREPGKEGGGELFDVTLTNYGYGYTEAPTITFSGGGIDYEEGATDIPDGKKVGDLRNEDEPHAKATAVGWDEKNYITITPTFSTKTKNEQTGQMESGEGFTAKILVGPDGKIEEFLVTPENVSGDNYVVGDILQFDNVGEMERYTVSDTIPEGKAIGNIKNVNQIKVTVTEIDEENINIPEGFQDPRRKISKQYKGTADGKNPQHMSNRTYGLELDLKNSPKRDGDEIGQRYPKEEYIEEGESSVNKLARQDGKYNEEIYPNNFIEEGGTAGNDKTLFDGTLKDGGRNEDRGEWVKPKYPFNHVYESESGHVVEIDDTPGFERINLFHRKGARIEINNKGEIHMVAAGGQDVNIQGKNVNINDYGIGTLNIRSAGKILMNALGDGVKIVTQGKTDIVSSGETKITSLKDVIMKAVKKVKIQ